MRDAVLEIGRQAHLDSETLAEDDREFLKFHFQAFVRLQDGGRVSREHMPDLDRKLARDGGHGNVAVSFAGKEFPTPLPQR